MIFKQNDTIDSNLDLILPFQKGEVDDELIKEHSKVEKPVFEGEFGEIRILYSSTGNRIYLLGLGEEKDRNKLTDAFRKLAHENQKFWKSPIQIESGHLKNDEITQLVIGCQLAQYEIGTFKSDTDDKNNTEILVVNTSDIADKIIEGEKVGATINRIKQLVDAPSNQKTPEYIAQWATDSAQQYNYTCEVTKGEALKEKGLCTIMAVGRGAEHPPCMIELAYLPKDGKVVDIGLVGKGITFDSGGLSIKGAQNMHYMKSDMGGAAVVLGVIELAVRMQLNVNIIGIVAAAENAVDANSIRPGDVINSYSGKTIEIIDTDAEGRLVLADGLSYINKNHKPDRMIDLATLTGSVVRTLGYSAAGMFTNNEKMSEDFSRIGKSIHERVWRLPLYAEFEEDLHSDIADIRNFSGKPIAGAITAAKFLEAFTEKHESWMHLDIAGVAFGSSEYAKMKSATGYGVRLLFEYLKTL